MARYSAAVGDMALFLRSNAVPARIMDILAAFKEANLHICPVVETHPPYGLLRLESGYGQRNDGTPRNIGNRTSATFSVSHGRVGTAQNSCERSVYDTIISFIVLV